MNEPVATALAIAPARLAPSSQPVPGHIPGGSCTV